MFLKRVRSLRLSVIAGIWCISAGISAGQSPATPADHAQHRADNVGHDAHSAGVAALAGPFGAYPMNREASGTGWQPESSPMPGFHFGSENTLFMVHGFAHGIFTLENGPRGDRAYSARIWRCYLKNAANRRGRRCI